MLCMKYLAYDHWSFFFLAFILVWHAVAQWLRLYATRWKVTGLRPDEVNEFFQCT
jgi:hypothetical protein